MEKSKIRKQAKIAAKVAEILNRISQNFAQFCETEKCTFKAFKKTFEVENVQVSIFKSEKNASLIRVLGECIELSEITLEFVENTAQKVIRAGLIKN